LRRRDLIKAMTGSVASWPFASPLAAQSQQAVRMRRIGLLITGSQSNALSLAQAAAIRDGLEKLGWVNGRNVQIEFRFGDSLERLRAHAADFGAMNLDVIFAGNASALVRLKEASGATPIVFANVPDPGWYRRLPPAERVSAHPFSDLSARAEPLPAVNRAP